MFQDLHLRFVLVKYGKAADTKTTIFERRVDYLQFPRTGGLPHHAGPHGPLGGMREAWAKAIMTTVVASC